MLVTIRTKNKVELEPKVKNYAEAKLAKLEQYFSDRDNPMANVLVKDETFLGAIDLADDKLENQIKKHKSKIYSSMKRREGLSQYYSTNNDFDLEKMKTEVLATNLVKSKQVDLKPMTVDDAITQMELLDHDFFIFLNTETNKVCVVYLRNDDDYGIIETNM